MTMTEPPRRRGRPRVALAVRVADASFDADRAGHRAALLEDELPLDVPCEMWMEQAGFRHDTFSGQHVRAMVHARRFERVVRRGF